MVVCLTLMFGYLTANASRAPFRAVPSAGDDSHCPRVTSPLIDAGSKAFSLSAGAPDSPVPPVEGAPDCPVPPHAAARNIVAKVRVRKRFVMDVSPVGFTDALQSTRPLRRSQKVRAAFGS